MRSQASLLRSAKRQRTSEGFQRGSVMKVRVKNFMTYAEAEITPGPRLNLVLGPNGTGKSSLVCAICVGLAGGTKLLGRAEDVSSFVRRGTRDGWVEITLSAGEGRQPYVIKRTIHASTNSSEWQLNGRDARMRDVEAVVEELHIQLDNLCQFLPQDKVVEFARMKPVQLLHATEQAIDNGELYEQHEALWRERSLLGDHESAVTAVEGSLARLRDENTRNERTVTQMRRRNRLLAEVEEMKKKVPWLEYQRDKDAYTAEKKKLDDTKEQVAARKQALRNQEGPLKTKRALLARLERERKAAMDACAGYEAKLLGALPGKAGSSAAAAADGKGLEEQLNEAVADIRSKQIEVDGLAQQSKKYHDRLAQLESEAQRFQAELEALPTDTSPAHLEERRQLQAEQQDVQTQLAAVKAQMDEVGEEVHSTQQALQRLEQQQRQLKDAKRQRLTQLEGKGNRGITRAWEWLQKQENKQLFRGRVYGPIAAEVECPNPRHAAYLEQHVANNIWTFFVTEFQEDQDALRKALKAQLGFTPNVSNFTGNAEEAISYPHGDASRYSRYGITHTLDQVFTAPSLVKHVLCEESSINSAFVGNEQCQANLDRVLNENREISCLWVPDSMYRRTFSRYNSAAESKMVIETRPAKLLSKAGPGQGGQEQEQAAVAVQQKMRDLQLLQRRREELGQQEREVQGRCDDVKRRLDRQQQKVQENINRRRNLTVRMKQAQKALEGLRKQPDPLSKKPAMERALQGLRKKAFSLALDLTQTLTSLAAASPSLSALDLALKEAREQADAYNRANREAAREVDRLEAVVRTFEGHVKEMQAAVRRKKQEAEAAAPLTPALNEKFAAMPDTLQELQHEMDTKVAEAEGICISNPAALEEYNRRCEEIHRQEGELSQLQERRDLSRAKIDDLKASWLPRLHRVVAHINTIFSASFARVGCAGEVVLKEAEGEDFANYAIEIRVKFRDHEELCTLDANRQSGGERSVSTMLYLISLQGVTVTPFRVVDEINQGMDPINERKIFKQLVAAACSAGTPQCFLLTPKLLPDLPFTRDVRVLQIMNGPLMRDVATNFRMERLLGSQRMSQLSQQQGLLGSAEGVMA